MKGFQLFSHSVRMVFGNLKEVIQIGLVPYVLATVIAGAVLFSVGLDFGAMFKQAPLTDNTINGAQALAVILAILAYGIAALWVVVNWHCFILLEERPTGFLPLFHGGNILSYFGRSLLITIVVILPLVVFFAAISSILMGPIVSAMWILGLVFFAVVMLLFFRFAAILPAAAIGEPMKLKQAWTATSDATGAIVICAVLLGVTDTATGWMVDRMFLVEPILGLALSLLQQAATGIVGVSILTTIYGHYVEGRELS